MSYSTEKLGKYIDILSGYAFKSKDFSDAGVPVIKIKNITPPYVSLEDITYVPNDIAIQQKKFLVHYDDILIALTGSHINQIASVVGRIAKVKFSDKALLNQRVGKIYNVDTTACNLDYVYYFLSQEKVKIELASKAGGAANQANISPTDVKNLQIPFPSKERQNRIANILSAYDNLIENNQKQIKLLEEAAQRLYKEWFVDLRFPGYETTPVVDGVPKGWKIYKFSEKIDIMSGGTPKTDNANFYGGQIPFYTPKDSNGNFFTFSTITNITEEGLSNCNSKLYPPNTIIITARGTVGKTTLLAVPMAMNQSCYALKSEELNAPYYLFFALKKEIAALQTMANGGVFDAIIVKTFDSIHITIPPRNLIVKFENTVTPIMEQIKVKIYGNRKLVEVRDRLLPKLMSGEVEV